MKIYVMPCVCDVCGGEGMSTVRDAGAMWFGGYMRHKDPAICAENLRLEKKRLEALKKDLETKETNL